MKRLILLLLLSIFLLSIVGCSGTIKSQKINEADKNKTALTKVKIKEPMQENKSNEYTISGVFESGEITIDKKDGYDLLRIKNLNHNHEFSAKSMPLSELLTWLFPLRTIIHNVTYEFSDPEDITLNFPDIEWGNYVDRKCGYSTLNESVDTQRQYRESDMLFGIRINPIKIIDCEQGKIRIYKKVKYQFKFVPFTPVVVTHVRTPEQAAPESTNIPIEVNLLKVIPGEVKGAIVVKDEKRITQVLPLNVTDTQTTATMEVSAHRAMELEHKDYFIQFLEINPDNTWKNKDVDFYEFSLDIKGFDVFIEISDIKSRQILPVKLIVNNHYEKSVNALMMIFDSDRTPCFSWENAESTEDIEHLWELRPGKNVFDIDINTISCPKGRHGLYALVMTKDYMTKEYQDFEIK